MGNFLPSGRSRTPWLSPLGRGGGGGGGGGRPSRSFKSKEVRPSVRLFVGPIDRWNESVAKTRP